MEKYRDVEGWGDQTYVNQIKHNLRFGVLPLDLFPNGQYLRHRI